MLDVMKSLDKLMVPIGFERRRRSWNRRVGDVIDVVDCQVSAAGDAFTIEVGVLDSRVYALCWGALPPEHVEAPHCTVHARLGELVDQRDRWWQLEDRSAAEGATDLMTSHGLPFLERMRSTEEMVHFLESIGARRERYPLPAMCLATLQHLSGHDGEAASVLDEVQRRTTSAAWRSRVTELRTRLWAG